MRFWYDLIIDLEEEFMDPFRCTVMKIYILFFLSLMLGGIHLYYYDDYMYVFIIFIMELLLLYYEKLYLRN